MSANHKVSPENVWIAIVSTVVETAKPEWEIEAGLKLLGPIFEKFVSSPFSHFHLID